MTMKMSPIGFFADLMTSKYFLLFIAFYIVVNKLVTGYPVQGWSSLMVAILFLGSVQLVTIGILGEYIGRIYDEVKGRPLFILDEEASRLAP